MTAGVGLPDPLADVPRPGGDPEALLDAATRLRRVARSLGEAASRIVATVPPADWRGYAAAAFASATVAGRDDLLATAELVDRASDALPPLAATLREAQRSWDGARRAVERDDAAQLHEHARVTEEARQVRLRNTARLATAVATVPLALEVEPVFRPDPRSPGRAAARAAAQAAVASVEREQRRCGATLGALASQHRPPPDLPVGLSGPVGMRAAWSLHGALDEGRPGEWARLALGAGVPCYPDAGYGPGGVVTGPDGRRYAAVVPWVADGDGPRHLDTAPTDLRLEDLDGRDPGWATVEVRDSTVDLGTADVADTVAVLLSGATPVSTSRTDLLPELVFGAGGAAVLARHVRGALPGRPPDADGTNLDRQPGRLLPASSGQGRVGAASAVSELVARGAVAADVHRQGVVRVQAVFEENVDGRRRVLLQGARVDGFATGVRVAHVAPVLTREGIELQPVRVRGSVAASGPDVADHTDVVGPGTPGWRPQS